MKFFLLYFFLISVVFPQNKNPIVLIHGFFGWGNEELGDYKYWGGKKDIQSILESHGYKVIRLHRSLLGPRLLEANSQIRRTSWHPTNFLATIDEERAWRLTKPRGWDVLRRSHLPLANNIT